MRLHNWNTSAALLLFAALSSPFAVAQKPDAPPTTPATIASKTAGMMHRDGFVPVDWDAKSGKVYLEVKPGVEMITMNSLPWGTGSNDLGLDRGQTSPGQLVSFVRVGPKVLLTEPNERFRSGSSDPAERLAVTQSFPTSVLFGFKVEAESPDGTVLIDATDFFLRDGHNITESLGRLNQGVYRVDPSRSTIIPEFTKAFPKNTEVQAELTFVAEGAPRGQFVRDVTPDPHAMTVQQRFSFIALPEPGYTPRRFDPRAGYFETIYRDYTVPLGEDLDQRFIERHRLIKKDPNCRTACEPVAPIQYYVDRGAPEPMRSALLEGARWWNQAFTAAGWKDAFKVDILPADADPMDVRYNIIQWVHRYTRGWSYGATVIDPRTGEILKGNVTLGSLRGRQDYMIAESLLSPYKDGKRPDPAHDPMLAMVLARLRQLAAHETGHTLGLAHNYIASASKYGNRGSVMEYPHPYVTVDAKGYIDISHAYETNIGEWDKVSITYGYSQFATGADEHEALNEVIAHADANGLIFLTDQDARPFSSAHPHVHLWDNGANSADELLRVLEVRKAALAHFGADAVLTGEPLAELEKKLVTLYLFHRYQAEATIKSIGGLEYRYSLRGDGSHLPTIVDAREQEKALNAVLKTLSPETLTIPESILQLLPPVPPGYPRTRESFPSETGLTFDPVAAAESAADLTLSVLMDPARAARLVQYHMRESKPLGLRIMLEAVSNETARRVEDGHSISSEVARAVEFRALEWELGLAVNPETSSQARAIALYHANDLLAKWKAAPKPTDSAESIHRDAMIARVEEFLRSPEKFVPAKPLEAPPGMPIGDEDEQFLQ